MFPRKRTAQALAEGKKTRAALAEGAAALEALGEPLGDLRVHRVRRA
jgi:hypothetical protein